MIGLIQRVTRASVEVDEVVEGQIDHGILLLLGVEKGDDESTAKRLLERVINYRIFEDASGRMNLSLLQRTGGLLVVPQFTLAADTRKGMRPSFTPAAVPDQGELLFEYFVAEARQYIESVQTGVFGADMQVSLINDGPATFWLTVKNS